MSERPEYQFPHLHKTPQIDPSVFVAPGATVLGDVTLGPDCTIWYGAVLRGDVNFIRVGRGSNIQDCCVIHVTYGGNGTVIGDFVTVGHSAVLHACTVKDKALIGIGAVVLDGAEIGEEALLGAGSLVTPGMKIPARAKAFGRPAKVVGMLTDAEIADIRGNTDRYIALGKLYRVR